MKPILVIWEEVRENTKIYLVQPENDDTERSILNAHFVFMNLSDNDSPAQWLGDYLMNRQPLIESEKPGVVTEIGECRIVLSGIML